MKKHILLLVLAAGASAFGEAYDRAKHGYPIVVTEGTVEIDGLVDGVKTVIDGGGKARCATLGPDVTLKNFVLQNGAADWGGGACGGTLVNCEIVDCTADLAGGAYGATLEGCTVRGCSARESGAALGACTAANCTLSGNRHRATSSQAAIRGGIVYESELTGCTLNGNVFEAGPNAPTFGAIGEKVTLTNCTVERNTVACDPARVYGLKFAYAKIDGKDVEFDDGITPVDPVDPDDPVEPSDFDGSVANVYTATLADGSVLSVSTAKESVKGGVATVAVTAKLTKGTVTYAYSGGRLEDGEVVELPTSRVYGSPSIESLELRKDTMSATVGGETAEGAKLTEKLLDESLTWTPDPCSRVGVAYVAQVSVADACGPVKYSVSGLPSGLKIDKATGAVTGVPTKAKSYWAKVTMTSALNSKIKVVKEIPIEIVPLDSWVEGTYNGGGERGQLQQFKVAKNGKMSGKWISGGTTWTLTAKSFDAYDAVEKAYTATLVCKSGKTVNACVVTLTSAGLVGACDVGGAFEGLRDDWKYEPWKTLGKRLSKAEPLVFRPTAYGSDADDRVTLKVSANGAVKAKGEFVKGVDRKGAPTYYSTSASSVLCPQTEPTDSGSFIGVTYLSFQPKAKTPIASDGAKAERVVIGWDGESGEFYGPIRVESAAE